MRREALGVEAGPSSIRMPNLLVGVSECRDGVEVLDLGIGWGEAERKKQRRPLPFQISRQVKLKLKLNQSPGNNRAVRCGIKLTRRRDRREGMSTRADARYI